MLTNDFQEVSHDKHLRVDFSPARVGMRVGVEVVAFSEEATQHGFEAEYLEH